MEHPPRLPEKLRLFNGADMFAGMECSGMVGTEELLDRSGPGEDSGWSPRKGVCYMGRAHAITRYDLTHA